MAAAVLVAPLPPPTTKSPAATLFTTNKTIRPFWSDFTGAVSRAFPVSAKADYAAGTTDPSSWSGSLQRLGHNSWFSVTRRVAMMAGLQQPVQHTDWPSSSLCLSRLIADSAPRLTGTDAASSKIPTASKPKTKKAAADSDAIDAEDGIVEDGAEESKKKKEPKIPSGKAHRVRLYPTREQRAKLDLWFRAGRWTYNQCVEHYNKQDPGTTTNKKIPSKKELRALCVSKTASITLPAEFKDVPYQARDEAMIDFAKALQAQLSKAKHQKQSGKTVTASRFQMKFRSQLDESQTLVVVARSYNQKTGMFAWQKTIPMRDWDKTQRQLPATLSYDSRMQRTRLGHYYFCMPMPLDISTVPTATNISHVSEIATIDPGVRTFATVYGGDGAVTEWGAGSLGRIYRLCRALDRLQAKWRRPEIKHRKRYRMRRAARRIRLKIRNLVDELHKRFAKWLCESHRVVLLPKFETSNMVAKNKPKPKKPVAETATKYSNNDDTLPPPTKRQKVAERGAVVPIPPKTQNNNKGKRQRRANTTAAANDKNMPRPTRRDHKRQKTTHVAAVGDVVPGLPRFARRITSKTARAMLTLSHFRFRQRLLSKAREYPNCQIVICDEPYTSKTCGRCGKLHTKLGGSKKFKCPHADCGYVADRDVNGARNILLRYLTLHCNTAEVRSALQAA